jgi:hypothetical protein
VDPTRSANFKTETATRSGDLFALVLLDRCRNELLDLLQEMGTSELLLGGRHGMACLGLPTLAADGLRRGSVLREGCRHIVQTAAENDVHIRRIVQVRQQQYFWSHGHCGTVSTMKTAKLPLRKGIREAFTGILLRQGLARRWPEDPKISPFKSMGDSIVYSLSDDELPEAAREGFA